MINDLKEGEFCGNTFEDRDFSSFEVDSGVFEDCIFTRCKFLGVRMVNSRFLDCKFENCDLSMCTPLGATFRGTTFLDCKAIGVNWSCAAGIHSTSFISCKLDDSSWHKLDLRMCKFENSFLTGADFENARLDKASFVGAQLHGAHFIKTSLVETNFSSAAGCLIDPRLNSVKKTKISVEDASSVLALLGFVL